MYQYGLIRVHNTNSKVFKVVSGSDQDSYKGLIIVDCENFKGPNYSQVIKIMWVSKGSIRVFR